jgi:acyl dehydratase
MKPTKTITNFDPDKFLVVPEKKFDDLKTGDIFRAPSRTLTDAHAVAFQSVSADNHPVHYDSVWFTAPGATLFPHYIGESFIAFIELSCSFLKEVHSGDTLYSALEIVNLERKGSDGVVTTAVTVHNQRNELVLSGQHKYLLKA